MTHSNTRIVHRPARITEPLSAPNDYALAPPPQQGDAPLGGFPLMTLLPVLGSLSSITMIIVLRANPVMVALGAVILVVALVGAVGMALGQRGTAARARRRERERYLDYLETQRSELRTEHESVRRNALVLDPAPTALAEIARNPARLWERRRTDADFLRARVAVGAVPWFPIELPADANPVQPHDVIMAGEARALARSHSAVGGMPVAVSLIGAGTVSIVGGSAITFGVARALIAQLATLHAPDDLHIGLVVPASRLSEFEGFDLLPHTLLQLWDGPVQGRRIAPDVDSMAALLRSELSARASRFTARQRGAATARAGVETPLVLILDDTLRTAGGFALPQGFRPEQLGITVISVVSERLHEPSETRVRLSVTADGDARSDMHTAAAGIRIEDTRATSAHKELHAIADTMSTTLFAALASRLAPLRLSHASREGEAAAVRELDALEMLGIESIAHVTPERWPVHTNETFLTVPVAVDDSGTTVSIDLKESAHGGMGPHGICIGATGSGKSEFLRTLVLSLAHSHSPEDLAMILVDYKGGAAFTPFATLPHIAGLIDNLADDAGLIERARASIEGEIVRRQRLLKDAGSFASIADYRAARQELPELAPLPHLFLVIDEFGELLTAEPDFIDLLLQIGRIGRALGIHLLLASQRIEGGRLRGLESYLSYRVGLRTFSEQESSVILETPDAFHLPAVPGYGYLKVDTTIYTRFKAAYVSGAVPDASQRDIDNADEQWGVFELPSYNTVESSRRSLERGTADASTPGRRASSTIIDEVVRRLRPGVRPTAPIWLPVLSERFPLFQIVHNPGRKALHIPLGILDEPARQAQGPWEVDLTASGGHFAVVGAPQSGRSTFLRAFAAGAATTHTPREITMYGLDLTGSGLARLEAFPHVGGVATRGSREEQLRLLEELQGMLRQREEVFRSHRIESLTHFRAMHAAGQLPMIISPDVVLLVDGYYSARTEFEHLEAPLAELLQRGSSFGIHLVLGLTRWSEVTMSMQPLIGNRFELRLNDPADSSIARKLAETIRSDQPGRVLTDRKLFAHVALPAIDDVDDEQLGESLTLLAEQTAAAWNGPSASPIRLLPENLDPRELPDAFESPDHLPIGLRQDTMETAFIDLDGLDQHVLVFGDAGSGKTTLLRQMLATLIERYSADELVVAIMEPRGSIAAECPDGYLGGEAKNFSRARQLAAALASELDKRQNEGESAAMRIVLFIDDYDILSSGGNNPLEPLMPYLASARDLNFNVVLTRPVAGSARALYENTIQTLKDTGGTGIILSGERAEGPLWPGVHASQAVPGRAKLVRRGQPPRLVQIANQQGAPAPVPAPVG